MPILRDLLVEELQDLLHAETQLTKALPKMAKAAHDPSLKQGFLKHAEETKNHVERLKQAFEALGAKAKAKPCKAMIGLVEEGQEKSRKAKKKIRLRPTCRLSPRLKKLSTTKFPATERCGQSQNRSAKRKSPRC